MKANIKFDLRNGKIIMIQTSLGNRMDYHTDVTDEIMALASQKFSDDLEKRTEGDYKMKDGVIIYVGKDAGKYFNLD